MASKIYYIPATNDRLEKNVAIYCRVSTNEKEQLYSLSSQISALTRAVANVNQWRLADIFIDIGSAKKKCSTPRFERLLKECEAHNISVVLTKSISRFGRDTVDTLSAINRLKKAGVRLIFEDEDLDTDKIDSNLMISVMESFAQAETESRSDNIRGLAMRAPLEHQDCINENSMDIQKIKTVSLLLMRSRQRLYEIFSVGILMEQVFLVSLKNFLMQAFLLLLVRKSGINA